MLPELETLREAQTLDMRIAARDRELATVAGTLAGIDGEIATARKRLTDLEAEVRETGVNRRREEGELDTAEAAARKYGDQLLGARSNVEYKGLQQQIANTKKRIGGIEDRILGLMERADQLEGDLTRERKVFEKALAGLEAKKAEVGARAKERDRERQALRERRQALVGTLPTDLLARYERLRGVRHGLAVARASDQRCGACSIRLRPQLFEEVRAGNEILTCESCSRFLFFEPEPETETAPPAAGRTETPSA